MNKYGHRCGCQGGVCGIQYSSLDQFDACPISSPYEWPELLQVPRPLRITPVMLKSVFAQSPAGYLYEYVLSLAAYDFLNSDENSFNLNIGYNSTYNGGDDYLVGVPRSVNLVCMRLLL
ncbi:hypothetical protein BHM03_00005969 [Ensete ventricosum]|nr:hypothetical protein BHM03_00005969 [Ensete ventricosum]